MAKTLKEQRDALQAQVVELEQSLTKAREDVNGLTALVESRDTERETAHARINTLEAQAIESAAELETAMARVTELEGQVEALQAESTTAEQKAASIVAGLGHEVIPEEAAEQPTVTATDLWKQYYEIHKKDPAKATIFFREHKQEMKWRRYQ